MVSDLLNDTDTDDKEADCDHEYELKQAAFSVYNGTCWHFVTMNSTH